MKICAAIAIALFGVAVVAGACDHPPQDLAVERAVQSEECGRLGGQCCPYGRECQDQASVDLPSNVICERRDGTARCALCGGAGQPCCPEASGFEECGYPNACDPRSNRCEPTDRVPPIARESPRPSLDDLNGAPIDHTRTKASRISKKW